MTDLLERPVPMVPGGLPVLGHAAGLLRNPVGLLQSARTMGDMAEIRLGPIRVYVVNSPELVHQMLVTDASDYLKGRFFEKLAGVVGNGLTNSDGDFHRRQSRLVMPAFQHNKLRTYTEVMRLAATARSEAWTPGKHIDVGVEMYAMASEVVAKSLFGGTLGNQEIQLIRQWLPVFVRGAGSRVLSPVDWLEKLPTPGNRRFTRARTELRGLVDRLIHTHQGDVTQRNDLLSMLLAARDAETGEPMSPGELRDEAVTMLTAGIDTVSGTLTWFFYEVGRHPAVEEHLHAELDEILGSQPATFEDLHRLPYTQNVVNETLRLHSPAWILMRKPVGCTSLGAVEIPPTVELLYSPTTIHRDPRLYPRPMEFDPDRWLSAIPRGHAFLPFGAGPRKCIGANFALTEIMTVVATIAARWRLSPLSSDALQEVTGAVLAPARLMMATQSRPAQQGSALGDTDVLLPFAPRISPDAGRAAAEHLAWPKAFGLLPDPQAAERHARAHYAELAARFHPRATGPELDLGVDQMSWFFCFDDTFDGPVGTDPRLAESLVEAVVDTLDRPPAPSAPPIVLGFADLWRRSCEGMSPVWTARAADHWRAYLNAHLTETANRHRCTVPTVDEHLRLRRDTIGVQPTIDLAERLGHYEVPSRIFGTDQMAAMRRLAAEIASVHNDIYSVEKEQAQADPHNLIFILQRDRSITRGQALQAADQMLRERADQFLALEHTLPILYRTLRLDKTERTAVQRYTNDALRTVMRGPRDWAKRSARYSQTPKS